MNHTRTQSNNYSNHNNNCQMMSNVQWCSMLLPSFSSPVFVLALLLSSCCPFLLLLLLLPLQNYIACLSLLWEIYQRSLAAAREHHKTYLTWVLPYLKALQDLCLELCGAKRPKLPALQTQVVFKQATKHIENNYSPMAWAQNKNTQLRQLGGWGCRHLFGI